MSPRRLLIAIYLLPFLTVAAHAQSVSSSCAGMVDPTNANGPLLPCNSSSSTASSSRSGSSPVNDAVAGSAYQLGSTIGYSLGYQFGQWLFGSGSNSDAAAQKQQQLQKQRMMEEIQRRQAEAERQSQAEEARRLAEMYNRLASTLKLGGLPNLQLKASGSADGGLHLKLGDSAQASTIPGLPGSNVTFDQHLSDLSSPTGLQLKLGDGSQASGIPGSPGAQAGGPSVFDFNKMTPQQLADLAESFSKLPLEEQQRLMAGAQAPAQQQQVMRDFQQTLDGKSDLTRVGSSSATPNAGNQPSSINPAALNSSTAAQPNAQAPQGLPFIPPGEIHDAPAAVKTTTPGARAESPAPGGGGGNGPVQDTPPTVSTSTQTAATQPVQGGNSPAAGLPAQQLVAPQSAIPNVQFDQTGQASGTAANGLTFTPLNAGTATSTAAASTPTVTPQAQPRGQPQPKPPSPQGGITLPQESDLQFLFPEEPSMWPGPKDPNFPLINPLREEALYQQELSWCDDEALKSIRGATADTLDAPTLMFQDEEYRGIVQKYAPELLDRYQRDENFRTTAYRMMQLAHEAAAVPYFRGIADACKAGILAYRDGIRQLENDNELAKGMGLPEQEKLHPELIPKVQALAVAAYAKEEAEVEKAKANTATLLDQQFRPLFDQLKREVALEPK